MSNYRRKPRLLFVGRDNSTHTQMAEGYMRIAAGESLDVQSTGMESKPIDPLVLQVMDEDRVDIRQQQSSLISAELLTWADLVVTISENPQQLRVAIPRSAHHKHWAVRNPHAGTDEQEVLRELRECRDEIKRRVQSMINTMRLFRAG